MRVYSALFESYAGLLSQGCLTFIQDLLGIRSGFIQGLFRVYLRCVGGFLWVWLGLSELKGPGDSPPGRLPPATPSSPACRFIQHSQMLYLDFIRGSFVIYSGFT